MFVREMGLQWGESEAAAQRTLDHARLAGNRMMVARAIPSLGYCALSGPTPVPDAVERCRALLEEVRGDRKPEALLEAALSHLEAMRGNVGRVAGSVSEKPRVAGGARLDLPRGADVVRLGSGRDARRRPGDRRGGVAARLRGAGADGRDELHLDDRRAAGGGAVPAGDLDGAEEHTRISEELAAQDDVSSQFRWRGRAREGLRLSRPDGRGREARPRSRRGDPARRTTPTRKATR